MITRYVEMFCESLGARRERLSFYFSKNYKRGNQKNDILLVVRIVNLNYKHMATSEKISEMSGVYRSTSKVDLAC